MSSLGAILEKIICKTMAQHNVPAISIALWDRGLLHHSARGILNISAEIEATSDSVFQIGSITKVMTACLVMQLVDEGKVSLDAPIKHYLRDFMISDVKASEEITVRQLLNHTSGMAGDFFPDDEGHSGNLIARYVDRCNLLPLVHRPGSLYSYSNSAFVIAGRLVEVVRGVSWYQAMENHIFKPLGMKHSLADPKELIRYRAAMGHLWDGNHWILSPRSWLPLGMAPCGSTPTMSASDLILFARAHLDAGQSREDKSWLSEESVQAMKRRGIRLPQTSKNISRYAGLGWGVRQYGSKGSLVYGHTGATHGFYASLQLCPDKNAAFALLINGVAPAAFEAIQNDLLREVFGIETQDDPILNRSGTLTPSWRLVAGRYESMDKVIVIREEENQLVAHLDYKIDPLPSEDLRLHPLTDKSCACETMEGDRRSNWAFIMDTDEESPPSYLFDGSRLNQRSVMYAS